jgi:hypothetical protein
MNDTIITVEGSFDFHHPAERGTVRLAAGFQGSGKEDVVARTTQLQSFLSAQVQAMTDGTSGPVTWWSADRVRVWSERPWNQDGKQLPLVHHCTVGLQVKFSDLGRLAGWVEEIAGYDGVSIAGIDWTLTEAKKSSLVFEVRDRAIKNAVEKASSYARSLGLSNVRPVAVADPGMLGDQSSPSSSPVQAYSRAASTQPEPQLNLKPEDITVSWRVHARFAAS